MFLKERNSLWYLDSGYSRHMTGDKLRLTNFVSKEGGYVTFGDNNKGIIMGKGNIRNQVRRASVNNWIVPQDRDIAIKKIKSRVPACRSI